MGDRFAVCFDGRAARTPGGRDLLLPTVALAERIGAEWPKREAGIDWASRLATRLAFGALDAGPSETRSLVEGFVQLAEADLLCYRAASPRALARRQALTWGPILSRVEARLDVRFALGAGIAPVAQDPAVAAAAKAWVDGLDRFSLVAANAAARLFCSAILAIALSEEMLDADAVFAAANLDESFQRETWGEDFEAAERHAKLLEEARGLAGFLAALRRP